MPHHGLDLVEPDEPFTLADFAAHARDALAGIAARGGIAILVGGTGLYLRAVARGIDTDALPSDAALRAALEADPRARRPRPARRRGCRRSRRGERPGPTSATRAASSARWRSPQLEGDARLAAAARLRRAGRLDRARASTATTHRDWIATRARAQFDAGLIEEARALRERFDPALPAFSAIGYREAWAVLDGDDDRRGGDRGGRPTERRRSRSASERGSGQSRDIEWLDAQDEGATRVAALAQARDLLRPSG